MGAVRFVFCERSVNDDSITATSEGTDFRPLTPSLRRCIVVPLEVVDDGTNAAVKLGETAKEQLRGIGRVYYTEAKHVLVVEFPTPRPSMAVPFSLSDDGVAVKHMTKWAKSKTELKEGAMVLSVNGERCHGADDARRMLRDTCADKSAKLVLQVWSPPEDFVHACGGRRWGCRYGRGEGDGGRWGCGR